MIRFVIVAVCILLGIVSIQLGRQEFRAIQTAEAGEARFAARLVEDEAAGFGNAGSVRAQSDQMRLCTDWHIFGLYSVFPDFMRQSLSRECLRRAEEILERSPTRSVALLAAATAHFGLDASGRALDVLTAAQATGPNEGWLAFRRMALALSVAADLPVDAPSRATVLELAARELPVLTRSRQLADRLAPLYLAHPELRDWMVTEVEQLAPEAQRIFLTQVRRASREQVAQ